MCFHGFSCDVRGLKCFGGLGRKLIWLDPSANVLVVGSGITGFGYPNANYLVAGSNHILLIILFSVFVTRFWVIFFRKRPIGYITKSNVTVKKNISWVWVWREGGRLASKIGRRWDWREVGGGLSKMVGEGRLDPQTGHVCISRLTPKSGGRWEVEARATLTLS